MRSIRSFVFFLYSAFVYFAFSFLQMSHPGFFCASVVPFSFSFHSGFGVPCRQMMVFGGLFVCLFFFSYVSMKSSCECMCEKMMSKTNDICFSNIYEKKLNRILIAF